MTDVMERPDAVLETPQTVIDKAQRMARESGRSAVLARNSKRRPEEAWDAFDAQLSMPDGYRVKAWVLVSGAIRVIAA